MRAKIPAKYQLPDDISIAEVISAVLRSNGLNPCVVIRVCPSGTIVELAESTLPAAVKLQIKQAVLPLLIDTTADTDLTA